MSSQRSTQADAGSALVPAIILFGGMTLLLLGLLASRPAPIPAKTSETAASPVAEVTAAAEVTEAPQTVAIALDPEKVKAGDNNYQSICSACHGFNALGIPGLGKTLIGSEFINSQTDDQLLAFLQVGRAVTDPLNTTGVMMPARGGNPNFTDDKLLEIIAYIRSINAAASAAAANVTPTATPSGPVETSAPAVFAPLDLSSLAVPTSIGGDTGTGSADATVEATAAPVESTPVPTDSAVVPTESSASVSSGEPLYMQTCAGCHAADGSGVQYVAKPLAESALLNAGDDAALLNFLINGDPALVPPHPFRGGYPELSDADLQSVITYLHGLPTGK